MAAEAARKPTPDFVDAGKMNIYLDSPEVGLVSISYEAAVNEWNLDDVTGFGKSIVVPESVFRRAAENFLKGS